GLAHLGRALGPAGAHGIGHAVLHVLVEQLQREALQRLGDRAHLGEHVDAVGVLLHHPLQPAHLALDAPEPLQLVLLVVVAAGHGTFPALVLLRPCLPSHRVSWGMFAPWPPPPLPPPAPTAPASSPPSPSCSSSST